MTKLTKNEIETAVLPAAQFAALLGITVQRVDQLKQEGTLTPHPGGGFMFGPALRQYTARLREGAAGRVGENEDGEKLDPQYEKALETKRKRELLDIQLAKARGEVVSSQEIIEVWQRVISASRSRIMSLATRLPNMLHHLEKKDIQIIDDEVRDVLTRLAADGEDSLVEVRENAIRDEENAKGDE